MAAPDRTGPGRTHDHAPADHRPSRAEHTDLFEVHHAFAARFARRYARGTPIEPDDAAQIGRITCWHTSHRWVDLGIPFRSCLVQRIRWALIDEIRATRWVSGPRDLAAIYDHPDPISTADHPRTDDGGYELAEALADLDRADLPAPTRRAAALLASGMAPGEVAAVLGVHPSRISQHRRHLRRALAHLTRSDP